MAKPVILTGIRANNDLHIGNYFGALLPIVDMAKKHAGEYQVNLFVPDLHSFTTPIDHSKLFEQTMNNLKLFVAAGLPLDAEDVYIYRQSYVPAHSELAWILDCFTGVGEMTRMTQFKDKQAKLDLNQSRVSMGLLNYPILMACDILLYGTSYVPVGDDQKQHIEYTRDIAMRMNSQFSDLFVIPKSVEEQNKFFETDQGLRIKSLSDPSKKMSKSDDSDKGAIFLNDDPEIAAKKIMSAETDSLGNINYDVLNQPGISNLLQLLSLYTDRPLKDVIAEWQGKTSYGDLKSAVADQTRQFLSNFQSRLLEVNEDKLKQKLEKDEVAMNKVASETLYKVQRAVGLRSSND